MKENPFGVFFGRASKEINRTTELENIYAVLEEEPLHKNTFVLTGPRGCGKTVLLGHILEHYRAKKDWVVARINLTDRLLEQTAGLLYEDGLSKSLFAKGDFPYSFSSAFFHADGSQPVSTIEVYLTLLLAFYKGRGVHALLAIDDVAKGTNLIVFLRMYQSFLANELDARLVMTGLSKNIHKLANACPLIFRCRAFAFLLPSLSLEAIAQSYQRIFKVKKGATHDLAKLTGGYATAYQLLGEILYEGNDRSINSRLLQDFDEGLAKLSYDAIWSDLTQKERRILALIAEGFTCDQEIASQLSINQNHLAIYKKQLCQQGLVKILDEEKWILSLPRFDRYIRLQGQTREE